MQVQLTHQTALGLCNLHDSAVQIGWPLGRQCSSAKAAPLGAPPPRARATAGTAPAPETPRAPRHIPSFVSGGGRGGSSVGGGRCATMAAAGAVAHHSGKRIAGLRSSIAPVELTRVKSDPHRAPQSQLERERELWGARTMAAWCTHSANGMGPRQAEIRPRRADGITGVTRRHAHGAGQAL